MTTGEKIKKRREELGMSQVQLAEKLGIDKASVGRYEKGQIEKIPYLTFIKILIALNTTPSELLSEEETELVDQANKLQNQYDVLSEMQSTVARRLAELPERDLPLADAFLQGLLSRHKE